MRIWSLHPRHLDRAGLVACWRETLLAQAVLAERTRGYRHHPQLERFRAADDPLQTIGRYLATLADEADHRGYRFDRARIDRPRPSPDEVVEPSAPALEVTEGQLMFEWQHLGHKLRLRSAQDAESWASTSPTPHPLFHVMPGPAASWERALGDRPDDPPR
ncbi:MULTISPECIES: pyrimidine dimer DNA glycosylase/endonuclease V [Bacteria]|uniref:pyrimidine dimer DNA glycosylase/endonuclease V n=1 Tax=Bacteria TaxID=2 RepID=UPI003C7B3DFE